MITGDALHCQRAHADYLHARGAHYLFTVKANQPTLRTALARLPWAQVSGLRERHVGHGRTESRAIKVMAALRNTAINIIRLRGGTNIAAAHRDFSYRPADVLHALAAA